LQGGNLPVRPDASGGAWIMMGFSGGYSRVYFKRLTATFEPVANIQDPSGR